MSEKQQSTKGMAKSKARAAKRYQQRSDNLLRQQQVRKGKRILKSSGKAALEDWAAQKFGGSQCRIGKGGRTFKVLHIAPATIVKMVLA